MGLGVKQVPSSKRRMPEGPAVGMGRSDRLPVALKVLPSACGTGESPQSCSCFSSNSIKKSQPPLPVSKIDDRLEQYTQAIEVGCCVASVSPPSKDPSLPGVGSPTMPFSLTIWEVTTESSPLGWEQPFLLSLSPFTA